MRKKLVWNLLRGEKTKYDTARLLSRPNLQSLFFFWAEQRSEGWGTYLRRWFGGGGEGNSIFASASNSHLHQEREERRRGKLSSPLTLSSPTKKSVGKLLFPTPIISPPFSSSHLRPKDQFLIWKVGKEEGELRKNNFEAYWREKSICFPPFCFFFCLVQKWAKQVSRELEILPRLLHLFVQNSEGEVEKDK